MAEKRVAAPISAAAEKPRWRQNVESIALAILIALAVRSSVVQAFWVPSGSMLPTIQIGDHIFVNKLAYSVRVPLIGTEIAKIGDLHRGVLRAIQYAQSLSPAPKAVYVELDPERTRRLEERWTRWGIGLALVVLNSPYRSLLGPLVDYIDQLQARDPDRIVTIILPEFVPAKWWQHLLHNQRALLIKGALLFRPNTVVTSVPFHLAR